MKFSKFIKQGPKRVAPLPRAIPGAILQGTSWHVYEDGGEKVLSYLTGENPEREAEIRLTPDEYAQLAAADDGEAAVTAIVTARDNARRGAV